eukprot:Mycagemm_TRINITY_DN11165_c0_g1::TRINITY_DN11165_c0_g1_i1::g.4529::m.4529 type:complete len:144 gc:universal TRINITY_DN11165_c0_g1_i1:435-4(-)
MVGPPAALLSNFLTFIAIHTVYLYFLDWNFFCLLLRCTQLASIWKGVKEPQLQKFLFAVALFINLPVLLLQWLLRDSHSITINFVGPDETASGLLIVLWIAIVLGLQVTLMLNSRIFQFTVAVPQAAQQAFRFDDLIDVSSLV